MNTDRKQQVLEALNRLVQALYSDNGYYKRFSDGYGMIMKDYNLISTGIIERELKPFVKSIENSLNYTDLVF